MIPLFKPHMPKLPELETILYSGSLASGKYVQKFEQALGEFIGVENVLVTNSYHMAILVTLSTLGINMGDEVLLSPMACLASTQPLLSAGLKIRWADIDPKTGTLSPDSVRERITKNTKLIIHNHYCGYIGYIDEVNAIGREYGIPVIDDGIEAFGGEYKEKVLGNVGTDVTIFSFNPVRIPNTIDGGAIIFKDTSLKLRSEIFRDSGIDRSGFRDELGEIRVGCDISLIGHSATMSEVNGYIGLAQMRDISELISKQRENGEAWTKYFSGLEDKYNPIGRDEIKPNYWVYGLLCENKNEALHEFRKLGYFSSSVHLNNNRYSVFGDLEDLPGVKLFHDKYLAVPSGWWMNK
jgi:perosamine synthetase